MTSELLATEILNPMSLNLSSEYIRSLIYNAEITNFTPAQNEQLAPRLLEIASQFQGSKNQADIDAACSAIRTGASMLYPGKTFLLLPFLDPIYSVQVSLVAMKMIGRIFEAHPPSVDIHLYPKLSTKIKSIATSLLNPYAISTAQCAAIAQLSIYALATMCIDLDEVIKLTVSLNQKWFTQQVCYELADLYRRWEKYAHISCLKLLNDSIQELRASIQ